MKFKAHLYSIFLIFGVFLSSMVVIAWPKLYFQIDMEIFWKWGQHWNESWKNIYISCAGCNYPIIGLLGSAGLMGFLENLGFEKAVAIFRFLLGLVDGLNVLLIFWLLKKLQIRKAAFWAGLIGVSASSWVGGALWGQIDGVSQFFILLTLAWIVKENIESRPSPKNFKIYLVVSGILMAWILLTKQLTIFSAFSLGLLILASILFYSAQLKQVLLNIATVGISFISNIFIWDFFLNLKEPYFSHLYYIWKVGSNHSNIISYNGFNLWMFLGREMRSSSLIPLAGSQSPLLSPYWLGIFLFVIYLFGITLSLFLFLKDRFSEGGHVLDWEILFNFIFHFALVNLSFNILLTGTHERYLYHFYPFIIIAWLGLRTYSSNFSSKMLSLFILGANLYGLFVLQILAPSVIGFRDEYLPHWIMGLFHFSLLAYLSVTIMKYQNFKLNLASLFGLASIENRKIGQIFLILNNKINITSTHFLFIAILAVGIFARVWEFGVIPPGLNTDEASIGIEAYNLYHYGLDRNGVSWPVHLISWGSGQNALYAYAVVPFIAIWGLSAVTIRLPMLLSGILSLPLIYYVGRRLINQKLGLISMFLLAISPWHIILSRWGLESNILPFIFLLGFVCLLKSMESRKWFIVACVFFALCLYAYGPAYLGVPVFLACAIPILIYYKQNSLKNIFFGLAAFSLVATPIILFIIVNTFRLDSIQIGPLTAPRLPAQARYELLAALFSSNPLAVLGTNATGMLNLLMTQSDGLIWNGLDPYGFLYTVTFPLAVIGAGFLIPTRKTANKVEKLLLLAWMIASLIIGVMQPTNLNRINLIFIPLFLCVGLLWVKLEHYYQPVSLLAVSMFLIGFVAFTRAYHGEDFRKHASDYFHDGLIPALDAAKQVENVPVCVTGTLSNAYIYILYTEKMNPADYANTIQWIDASDPFRETHALDRYVFGLNYCPSDPKTIFVLSMKETPPDNGINYTIKTFSKYRLYIPES